MRVNRLLPVVLAAVAAAGSSCGSSESGERDQREIIDLRRPHAEAVAAPGWLNVKTLQIHTSSEEPEPTDLIVRGTITGWYFEPEGDVQGTIQAPPKPEQLEPCYLSLSNRRIYYKDGGMAPRPPYVEGRFDPEVRLFYPDTSVVVRRPVAGSEPGS